jgi:hypothetical protein
MRLVATRRYAFARGEASRFHRIKRLELAGAAKQGRITFVRQMSLLNPASLRCARRVSARSSSASR